MLLSNMVDINLTILIITLNMNDQGNSLAVQCLGLYFSTMQFRPLIDAWSGNQGTNFLHALWHSPCPPKR